jgi:hypothetical protein
LLDVLLFANFISHQTWYRNGGYLSVSVYNDDSEVPVPCQTNITELEGCPIEFLSATVTPIPPTLTPTRTYTPSATPTTTSTPTPTPITATITPANQNATLNARATEIALTNCALTPTSTFSQTHRC